MAVEWYVESGSLATASVDALVVPIGSGGVLWPIASEIDSALNGRLTTLLSEIDFPAKPNTTRVIYTLGQLPARLLVLVGVDAANAASFEQLRLSAAIAGRAARDAGARHLALAIPESFAPTEAARVVVEGLCLGTYRDRRFKSSTESKQLASVRLLVAAEAIDAARQGVAQGELVAAGVCLARDLVNEPGGDLWPDRLAQLAASMAAEHGLACRVYDERALADLGAGALLAVGRGSDRPPRLIHLRYRPAEPVAGPLITFVGKGITFDTGGYSLKPAQSMETMKGDMAGAAAVIGAMQAIAGLKPRLAVDAVIVSAENMVSGCAMRPGDILRSMSGKTIEVNNTDAEGRLVLADALTFAIAEGAGELIDLATLTGACMVALGHAAAGVMGNRQTTIDQVLAAGAVEGERLWQLPLYDEYRETLKSEIADLRNSGGRYGGAQIGAAFIKEFAGETPWVHLDIAGPAWLERETPLAPKGPSGFGVRTLIRYALASVDRRTPV